MNTQRFEILFDQDAYKEYVKLDNSVAEMVDVFFEELPIHQTSRMQRNQAKKSRHSNCV